MARETANIKNKSEAIIKKGRDSTAIYRESRPHPLPRRSDAARDNSSQSGSERNPKSSK